MPCDAIVEQAKGVLILRFGISSYEALAVLGRWAAEAGRPLDVLARALTLGVCQGRWGTTPEELGLVRWLEARLRAGLPHLTNSKAAAHA